ncbi:MAG: sulfite exporter TauE/SafE family protein [Rectinema sp.]
MTTILLAGLVVFVTHALEAVTGFGCTVLALPFITALFGLKEGVMTLTVLAWLLAIYIALTNRKSIDWKQFSIIAGFVLLGLPVGMYLFGSVEIGYLKKVLAVFIIVASGIQLLAIAFPGKTSRTLPKPLAYALLLLGGTVHGMFSSGGPFIVLYASKALPEKGKFRATLCLLWATLNSIIIGGYIVNSSITKETAIRTGAMLPFLVAGIFAGEFIHKKVAPDIFKILVFSMLFVTGIVMLVV